MEYEYKILIYHYYNLPKLFYENFLQKKIIFEKINNLSEIETLLDINKYNIILDNSLQIESQENLKMKKNIKIINIINPYTEKEENNKKEKEEKENTQKKKETDKKEKKTTEKPKKVQKAQKTYLKSLQDLSFLSEFKKIKLPAAHKKVNFCAPFNSPELPYWSKIKKFKYPLHLSNLPIIHGKKIGRTLGIPTGKIKSKFKAKSKINEKFGFDSWDLFGVYFD